MYCNDHEIINCSLNVRFPNANVGRGLAPAVTLRCRGGWLFRKPDDSEQIYGSIAQRGRREQAPALRYGLHFKQQFIVLRGSKTGGRKAAQHDKNITGPVEKSRRLWLSGEEICILHKDCLCNLANIAAWKAQILVISYRHKEVIPMYR